MSKTARFKLHLVVLALYAVLAAVLSYPVLLHPATRVPGSNTWAFDEYTFIWNTWYFRHALLNLHTSPLHTNLIFYPLGIDLILYTYNVFNAAFGLPLVGLLPLPLVSNPTLWLMGILSAYGTFLLTLTLLPADRFSLRNRILAAFLAGAVYAFASNRSIYAAIGHYDMVSTAWLPFFALYAVRFQRRRRLRDAAIAGVFFTMAAYNEMIFAVFMSLFLLTLLLVDIFEQERGKRLAALVSWAKGVVATGFVAALLWLPLLIPILREMLFGHYELRGWGDSLKLSTDLLGFFTPTALHPLWGHDWTRTLRAVTEGHSRFSDVNTVFLGYATLALAALGGWKFRRKLRAWIWAAIVFGLLCLGPLLQIHGRYLFDLDGLKVDFPMPFLLLHFVPFLRANRAPNRNSVILMLALAVMAGFGAAWLLSKLRQRWASAALAVALVGLVIFEHLAVSLPTTNASIPGVYAHIASDKGNFSVLQFPLGWRDSFGMFGAERTQAQYYQSAHRHPIIGGNISREPGFKMAYFKRIPLFQAIAEVESGENPPQDLVNKAKSQAPDLLNLYAVRYVVLLPPVPGRQPYSITWKQTWAFAKDILSLPPAPAWQGDGVEVYRIPQTPVSEKYVEFGREETYPYRGEGWADNETIYGEHANWATATKAVAFLPPLTHEDHTVSVRAHPFAYPGSPPQTIRLLVNGRPVGDAQEMSPDWKTYTWQVPSDLWADTTNRLTFRFGWTARPRDVLPANTEIGKTGVRLPVDVYLEAAVDHAYIAIFDEKGRKTDGTSNAEGYNFAVLDRKGRLVEKRWFGPGKNHEMAQFVEELPRGAIVLAATLGSAANRLDTEGIQALRSLGSGITEEKIRGGVGVTHALAGVKGAAPGTAADVFSATTAYLRIGKNPDRRPLAAVVAWLRAR